MLSSPKASDHERFAEQQHGARDHPGWSRDVFPDRGRAVCGWIWTMTRLALRGLLAFAIGYGLMQALKIVLPIIVFLLTGKVLEW